MHARFFIDNQIQKDSSQIVISDLGQIHQISKVLRKKPGDEVVVLDNSGFEYECEVRQINKKLVLLRILKGKENKNEAKLRVALYQSLTKKDKMEFVFEKCTEVGVFEFHPIISENSVKLSFKEERAHKILKEATEQSQRGKIPELSKTVKFKKAIEGCGEEELNIIFHEKAKERASDFLQKELGGLTAKWKGVNIFVGPEGGFSEDEVKLAEKAGFEVLSLGRRVLRAETAAIVTCALILSFDSKT